MRGIEDMPDFGVSAQGCMEGLRGLNRDRESRQLILTNYSYADAHLDDGYFCVLSTLDLTGNGAN